MKIKQKAKTTAMLHLMADPSDGRPLPIMESFYNEVDDKTLDELIEIFRDKIKEDKE